MRTYIAFGLSNKAYIIPQLCNFGFQTHPENCTRTKARARDENKIQPHNAIGPQIRRNTGIVCSWRRTKLQVKRPSINR